MRLTGVRKNLYLAVSSKPEWNRKFLQLQRSFEEIQQVFEKDVQKKRKKS